MYASFLAEYNEATFVVFKVIELVVVANDKYIAIAATYNMHPSVAGLQGVIVCPTTTNGWSPYKSNILALSDPVSWEVVTWCKLLPSIFCTQRCLL